MSVLQARGEGLCPVNTECMTDSMVAFLKREGYTDLHVVSDKSKRRTSDASSPRRTSTRRRVVTRRPRE